MISHQPIDTAWTSDYLRHARRLKTIAAGARLNRNNVVGEMKIGKLVVLRGTYTRSNDVKAEHWLLGTLATALGNAVDVIVANDPGSGYR